MAEPDFPRRASTPQGSSAVVIRPARPEDLELVHDLVLELAAYERLDHEVAATGSDLAAALFCEAPKVACEIAEHGGAPAGFAIWFYTFSTFRGHHGIWLEDLFVRESFRRKGIGRALVTHLARRCHDEGLARLEWSVLGWNEPSILFYKTLGAQLMDDWTQCRIEGEPLHSLAGMPL